MMRDRIEAALGRWGLYVARNPWRIIATVLLFTLGVSTQIRHFYFETSNEAFFHPNDPVRVRIDSFTETFGRDSRIIIAFRPDTAVFDPDFLAVLRDIHLAIEDEVPNIVEVTSLWNVRETLGSGDGLEVRDFLEDWPESDAELEALAFRAKANPLYQELLLSEDGRATMIAIETEAYSQSVAVDDLAGFEDEVLVEPESRRIGISGEEDAEILVAIEDILERAPLDAVEVHIAGTPSFSTIIARTMVPDMARSTALSVIIVAAFLMILFRTAMGVLVPLVTVALSVFATMSVMGGIGIPLMLPTQIVPSFLMAVGVGGAVHLVAIFYQGLREERSRVDAIAHALSHSGLPILMTSLTTAAGLLSFIPAALAPISHFGIIGPIGVILALIYVLVLLPALLAVLPSRIPSHDPGRTNTLSQRVLLSTGRLATRRPAAVLTVWGLLMIGSLIGIQRIHIGHNMIKWFPLDAPIVSAIDFTNEYFGGAASYEILVSTGEENGLHEPEALRRIEALSTYLETAEGGGLTPGKVISIVDVVKETHRALNENREDSYVIPDERALISQELLLFENSGSDDVEDLVTSDFSTARLTVRLLFDDAAFFTPYMETILPEIKRILGPQLDFEITGMYRLIGNTITAALTTMLRSYSTALVVITILMVLLIGQVRMGLVAMIPNLAPVIFTLGLMGWLGLPLDMISLMVASIVIGLAVDDTIHFMHNFRREFEATGDVSAAVDHTLISTGQALLFTSCVLACGFLVYTQAYMLHLYSFGVTTSAAIVVAFLADVTLAPSLVAVLRKYLIRPSDRPKQRT